MELNRNLIKLILLFEVLIILFGFFYLLVKYPVVFQEQKSVVMVIDVKGEVISTQFGGILEKRGKERRDVTSAQQVVRTLQFFSEDSNIKAFILEIDAYEGQNAGQEEIVREMRRLTKPVVAVIKGSALSAGYYVASGADKIYSTKDSKIGEIAKVVFYVNRKRDEKETVCSYDSTVSLNWTPGDCKGFDSAEALKLKHYADITQNTLISNIALFRDKFPFYIKEFSKGEIILSPTQAIDYGLIDEIGNTYDAAKWLEAELGTKLWLVYLRDLINNETR
jgi:ClpP class serine protease